MSLERISNVIGLVGGVVGAVGGIIGIAGGMAGLVAFRLRIKPKLTLDGVDDDPDPWIQSLTIRGITNKGEGRADDVELRAFVRFEPIDICGISVGYRSLDVDAPLTDALQSNETGFVGTKVFTPDKHFPFAPTRLLWLVITCRDQLGSHWQFRYSGELVDGGHIVKPLRFAGTRCRVFGGAREVRESRDYGHLFSVQISPQELPEPLQTEWRTLKAAEKNYFAYRLEREGYGDTPPGFLLWLYREGRALLQLSSEHDEFIECRSEREALQRQSRYVRKHLPANGADCEVP